MLVKCGSMMRDLSRIHGEREIWITRGHLWALAMTTVFIGLLAFFVGLLLGRTRTTEAEPVPEQSSLITEEMEADALEELLARVEVAANNNSEEAVITFPEVLSPGQSSAARPPPSATLPETTEASSRTRVSAGRHIPEPPSGALSAGKVPSGGWAIQLASFTTESEADARLGELAEAGADAYWVSAVVDGITRYRVRIGGFSSRGDADVRLAELSARWDVADAIVTRAP